MPYIHPIHFTLDEARALLPNIIPILEQLRDLKQQLAAKGYDVYAHRYYGGMGPNGLRAFPDQLEELVRLNQKLTMKGILVKDIDAGLIDFPCIRKNHEEVYLCFRLGESAIEYWHRIEDGFPGRQPITTL
jgi:hypothetical protein